MSIKYFKSTTLLALSLIALLGAIIMYWRATSVVLNKQYELEKLMTAIYAKSGLSERNLTVKFAKEKSVGLKKYIYTYEEYNVPDGFVWNDLISAVKERLKNTRFRITDAGSTVFRDKEIYTLSINFGKFEIFSLKINKKKHVAPQPVTKKVKSPKVAIVMDDFGYNTSNIDTLFKINRPITLSILPNLKYSRQIAQLATGRGYEVILHLPLEPHRKDVQEEFNTIKPGMREKDVIAKLKKDISEIPGLRGVSNHQGSKATEDKALMTLIIKYLKGKNLYYFDSLTSEKSVCQEVSRAVGNRYARRDIFLDIPNNTEFIEKQLLELRRIAFKRGSAIAVCHDRKNTVIALSKAMPEMAAEGVEFVSLSEMEK